MSARNFNLYHPKKYGNVEVTLDNGIRNVYLHGNKVLSYDGENGIVTISHCGWITPTTRTAINTALNQILGFKHFGVFIKNGSMFVWGFKDTPHETQELLKPSMLTESKLKEI